MLHGNLVKGLFHVSAFWKRFRIGLSKTRGNALESHFFKSHFGNLMETHVWKLAILFGKRLRNFFLEQIL